MGKTPARPRRRARPHRRPALRDPGHLLPGARPVRRTEPTMKTVSLVGSTGSIGTPDPRRGAGRARPLPDRRPGRLHVGRRCWPPRWSSSGPSGWPSPTRPGPPTLRAARPGRAPTVRGRARGPGRHRPRRRRGGQRGGRLRRAHRHPGRPRRRAPPGPGQQGVADRRPGRWWRWPGARRGPRSCPSTPSTAPSTSACGPTPSARRRPVDRLARIVLTASGGPVPGPQPGRAGRRHRRRRPRPSHLVDGAQDHRRLVHPDEQGAGGDRGPRAVRRRLRPHRGGRPPPVDRPLDGGVHRRGRRRPAVQARHAPAHRLRPGLPRPQRGSPSAPSTGPRPAASTSSRPTSTPSPAWAWPTPPAAPAAPPRPGSTRPTRWRWPPSSRAHAVVGHRRRHRGDSRRA